MSKRHLTDGHTYFAVETTACTIQKRGAQAIICGEAPRYDDEAKTTSYSMRAPLLLMPPDMFDDAEETIRTVAAVLNENAGRFFPSARDAKRPASAAGMNAHSFVNACRIVMNLDKDVLEDGGVLIPGQVGGSDWDRLNRDPFMFLLKLPEDRLERLWTLIEARQPKQPKPDTSFHTALIVERLIRIKDRLTDQRERDVINEAVAALYKAEGETT